MSFDTFDDPFDEIFLQEELGHRALLEVAHWLLTGGGNPKTLLRIKEDHEEHFRGHETMTG